MDFDRKYLFWIAGALLLAAGFVWRKNLLNLIMPARIAFGEARNQGRAGMQAVLNVIYNRSNLDLWNDGKADWWGESPFEVATKAYQFSAYNDNDPNRAVLDAVDDSNPIFVEAVELSALASRGELADITGGATHYHTLQLDPPNWVAGATQTVIIGDHIFYKDVA